HTRFSRDWSSDVCSSDLSRSIRQRSKLRPAGTHVHRAEHLFVTAIQGVTGDGRLFPNSEPRTVGGRQPRGSTAPCCAAIGRTTRAEERSVGKRWSLSRWR